MKEIFYFTPYYFPHNGACAVRNSHFLKTLEKSFKIHLLTATKGSDGYTLFIKPKTNKSKFIIRLVFEILAGIELFIRVFFSKKDLYYFSSPNYFTVFIGALACVISKKKFVLDIRDIYPETYFKFGLLQEESLLGQGALLYTKLIYRHAQHIFTVTPSIVEIIQNLTNTPITLIPNGFDEELFTPSNNKYKKFTCVFHGTMGHLQAIELIPKVAQLAQEDNEEIDFLIIGDGSKAQLVQKAHHLDNINYQGAMKYQELPSLVNKAHLGLSFRADDETSLLSFPVKVFEYIGMELPIISTTNNEASKKILELKIGSYFENRQVQEIYQEIKRYKNDSNYLQSKIDNIQKVKNEFSRLEQAKKVNAILLKV